jgi:hypothetical protein
VAGATRPQQAVRGSNGERRRIQGRRRENGTVDGPEAEVVQWLRSLERTPGTLRIGRLACMFPEPADSAMVDPPP